MYICDVYMCVSMQACAGMCMAHMCITYKHIHIYVYLHTYTCVHMCMYVYACTCVRMCLHVCV